MRLPAKLRADRHLRNRTWPFLPVAVRHQRTFGQNHLNGRLESDSCR